MPKKIYIILPRSGKNKKNGKTENIYNNTEYLPIVRVPNAIHRGIIEGYDTNGNSQKNINESSQDKLNEVNKNIL